ncbi:MAG: hypothetical protein C0603_00770 [Denitrovibrio sp.]|nr:MAG: hypothetical protein C0603_00770 [Denitrovibrio sp.]
MKINSIFLVLILVFTISSVVYAEGFPFNCSECHESPSEIFKDGHAKIGNFDKCFDCHEPSSNAKTLGERVHKIHFSDMGVNKETCTSCHAPDSEGNIYVVHDSEIYFGPDEMDGLVQKFQTWMDSEELADSHNKAGVYCNSCHERYDPDDVDNMSKKCKGCHGEFKDVASFTADFERNPHKSHFGKLSCVKCHNVHESFKDYCDKCHHTNMKWTKRLK